jgi:hypothetical protein
MKFLTSGIVPNTSVFNKFKTFLFEVFDFICFLFGEDELKKT